MKANKTLNSLFLWMCMATIVVTTSSCASDDENNEPTGLPSAQVIQAFKQKFYNTEGVYAHKLNTYQADEFCVISNSKERPCDFFTELTGIEAPLKSQYKYSYKSADGSCTISIEGSETPVNGVYAILRINIPECSDIRIIHIGTMRLLDGENGVGVDGIKIIVV